MSWKFLFLASTILSWEMYFSHVRILFSRCVHSWFLISYIEKVYKTILMEINHNRKKHQQKLENLQFTKIVLLGWF